MIDPEGIRVKALRLYPQVLRDSLDGALSPAPPPPLRLPFPLDIPADRGRSTEPFAARRAGIERLYRGSSERIGPGYSLEFREVDTRREGRQTVVGRIFFRTREDYLAFLGKEREHADYLAEAGRVLARLPGLEGWIREKPLQFIAHLGEWDGLVRVCEHFLLHPRPGCYLRQLPIPVHTKFIEEHRGILQVLLDLLLPPSSVNPDRPDFEGRYFLKSPESLVRLRFLDPALAVGGLEDLTVPLSRFEAMGVSCRTVFVVENLMTFLAFPGVAEAVCIWGSGFQAGRLGGAPWLQGPRLLYWGDLDRAGFEILARLRRVLPRVESMLMDRATWLRYERFAVPDGGGRPTPDGTTASLEALLTSHELALYATLRQEPARGRLEQERVLHGHLQEFLRMQGFTLLDG